MGWIGCRCDAHWSRWASNNYITQCHRKLELVWSLESVVAVRGSESQLPDRGLMALGDPRLSSPAEWERSAAIARRAGGQYVAVFVQSPTHLSHITLLQPFQIKWEVYFSKELCFVCHYCVDYVSACVYVYGCICITAILQVYSFIVIAPRSTLAQSGSTW